MASPELIYSSTADGYVTKAGTVWSTCKGATDGDSVVSNGGDFWSNVGVYGSNPYYYIFRGFLYFDTSIIPDDATITEVTLRLCGSDYISTGVNLSALKGTQADTLTTADFDSFTGSEYGHAVIVSGSNITITFNAQGIADINKTGVTKICLMETAHDYTNSAPNLTPADYYFCGPRFTEYTGQTKDPLLTITYSVPVPNANGTFSLSGKGNISATGKKGGKVSFTLSGKGNRTFTGVKKALSTFLLSGKGNRTITGKKSAYGLFLLSGKGNLVFIGIKEIPVFNYILGQILTINGDQ